jgi:hypothetical protein
MTPPYPDSVIDDLLIRSGTPQSDLLAWVDGNPYAQAPLPDWEDGDPLVHCVVAVGFPAPEETRFHDPYPEHYW